MWKAESVLQIYVSRYCVYTYRYIADVHTCVLRTVSHKKLHQNFHQIFFPLYRFSFSFVVLMRSVCKHLSKNFPIAPLLRITDLHTYVVIMIYMDLATCPAPLIQSTKRLWCLIKFHYLLTYLFTYTCVLQSLYRCNQHTALIFSFLFLFFPYFFASGPCDRLGWPSRQLLSAR